MVFRRLLTREAAALPWRELARVYRRLEARGEIRGGRFVSGMSGEQFALPRAVERLREVRKTPADGRVVAISAADPLNLAGIVTSGDRIRPLPRTRVRSREGQGSCFRAVFPENLDKLEPAAFIERSTSMTVAVTLAALFCVLLAVLALYLLIDLPDLQRDVINLFPEHLREEMSDLGSKVGRAVGWLMTSMNSC